MCSLMEHSDRSYREEKARQQEVIPNPECRDGKHRNCDTEGWNTWTDEPANCPCECH